MTIRAIEPMMAPGVDPGAAATPPPSFEWVDPKSLMVDEAYQRDLSGKSVELIHKIVRRWDWARFKPPVVAKTDGGMEVIDGQHTAIAAATHPEIDMIPVMIVGAVEMEDRARAFVGHNRDRIALGPLQIHYANLAAQDEDALTVQQVCDRAGVRLLRYPPSNGQHKPGDSMAITSIRSLINRRNPMKARIILQVLVEANCAPVRADSIKAVELLLHDPEYRDDVKADDITTALLRAGPEIEREARVFAAAHSVPMWRAMAVSLFKEVRRGRRRAA